MPSSYEWSQLQKDIAGDDLVLKYTTKGQDEASKHFNLSRSTVEGRLRDIEQAVIAAVTSGKVREFTGYDGRLYFDFEFTFPKEGKTYIKIRPSDYGSGWEIHSVHS